jgi:hypothetical protein
VRPMSPVRAVEVPYAPPSRNGRVSHACGIRWVLDVDDPLMRERAEALLMLDPALPHEDAVAFALRTWGGFLCRRCGHPLVFDGQNGAGTTSLLCNRCGHKASIWNTYELRLFQYKKILMGILLCVHGCSVKNSASLVGIGEWALREAVMGLPEVRYSRSGDIEVIDYEGERFAVVTIDMIYKGSRGMMLGVSGGLSTAELGNENTGEGLKAFFDELERRIGAERYLFIMDMKQSVASMILERFKERAVIVLQSHSVLGDVLVYFNRNGWHTLHLRTDAFSETSSKRDEGRLLSPGEVELYEGLKWPGAGASARSMSVEWLKEMVSELLLQLANVDWEAEGRIDIVMKAKIARLNALIKELERRKEPTEGYVQALREQIDGLIGRYGRSIRRTMKRKIVNAWSSLKVLRGDVERLSEALLKEPLPERVPDAGQDERSESGPEKDARPKMSTRPMRVYRGPMDDPSVPEEGRWIIGLLKVTFGGKDITTNECEGRFGVIGMELRRGRSIYLERAVTRVLLQSRGLQMTMDWLVESYPMERMGRRGNRGERKHLRIGERYLITYRDRWGVATERVIDVEGRKGDCVLARCHLRNDRRTFKRRRIGSIQSILVAG